MSTIVPNGCQSRTRVKEHLDAGADHVVIQLLDANGRFASGDLAELATLVGDLG